MSLRCARYFSLIRAGESALSERHEKWNVSVQLLQQAFRQKRFESAIHLPALCPQSAFQEGGHGGPHFREKQVFRRNSGQRRFARHVERRAAERVQCAVWRDEREVRDVLDLDERAE